MIITAINKDNKFGLRWRHEDGTRAETEVTYQEFQPYFYVLQSNGKRPRTAQIKERNHLITIKLEYEDDGAINLEGDELTKVTWTPPKPGHTRILREIWDETYEADVPFHYRYAIDKITKIPEYNLVKWYWDLEWQQGGEYDGAITCISCYANEEHGVLYWLPSLDHEDWTNPKCAGFPTERDMLRHFMQLIDEEDPDMLISWFGSKFDLPKLIERLHANGLDPRKLSPYNDVKGVYFGRDGIALSKAVSHYTPIEQPIRGRICLNLDLAFERQWNDAQRGTLPSMALDYVSELVLGEKKLVSKKFPDKNDFFERGWLEDTDTYLEYALRDTELLKRIDDSNYTSEAMLSLQRLLIAPFDACFYASNMGGIYFMRNATWKAPTGKKGKKVDYQGAMIYDPSIEGTHGLHHNVAAFDFASLYPSMMIARNISWETKSEEPTEFGVNIEIPRDFSDETEFDYRYYKTDKLGLLPQSVLDLKTLRNHYKALHDTALDPTEKAKWFNNQMAVKRLMASFYGIVGYQGFGWADVDLAASITASAREAIREAAFKVMEL
jgi:DNA polymerase elongation subunit (family B)